MIEIIPNWHPIFVHFTVALLSVSAAFFLLGRFDPAETRRARWVTVGQWNLWLGAAVTLLTVGAGIYAFNTVDHDTPSHAAMIEHRNWALPTFVYFLAMAFWAWRARRAREISTAFVAAMLVGAGLLMSTAWHGAELVYRHGLGVMSLPKVEGEGHAHEHPGGGHAHGESPGAAPAPMSMDEGDEHAHDEDAHEHEHDGADGAPPHDEHEETADGHDDGHDHAH